MNSTAFDCMNCERRPAVALATRSSVLAVSLALAHLASADDSPSSWLDFYEDKTTGDYLKADITFSTAQFVQSNSWAGNDKELIGDNSNYWGEYGVAAGISGEYWLSNGSHINARFSGVYSSTAGGLDAGGSNLKSDGQGYRDANKATIEEAYVKWSSGSLFPELGKDALEFSFGSQVYKQGTGFLFYDAGSDGGSRGGFWLGLRKAYQYSAIVRLTTGNWMAEAYYLQPDSPGTKTDMAGANVEYSFGERGKLGASYTNIYDADDDRRNGLNIYDIRGEVQPFENWSNLRLSGEFVKEDDGFDNDSTAGYVKAAYTFNKGTPWDPVIFYRYAHFSGDDGTGHNSAFDPINYGFSDWNQWYIGEITGEYVSTNSNLDTHTLALNTTPREDLVLGLYYIYYRLDEKPNSITPRPPTNPRDALITDKNLGQEINLTADWNATDSIYVGVMAGLMIPEKGAKEFFGDDDNWGVLMLNLSYSF